MNFKLTLIVGIFLASAGLMQLNAQRASGDVGIGVQVGQPTGLTLKFFRETASVDLLAAWDWDNFFFLNLHSIYDIHLNDANTVHFFYGPGAFIGIRERAEVNDEVVLGVSGSLGLDFLIQKFEIYLQATPRLSLVKSTNFDMGGGVGFRIYL